MNLVIDAGNTLIKTAIYEGERMILSSAFRDWRPGFIRTMLESRPQVRSFLICSTRQIPGWLPEEVKSCGLEWRELSYELPLPVTIGYETPATLGKDRIAAAAGAAARFPGRNVLAIDAGTALTIDLITGDALFVGGNISPGLRMRFSVLHQQTHSLPEVGPTNPVPLLGRNTAEAILSGVVNGIVYEIDNSINSLKNKYNDLTVILTGGDAAYLSRLLKNTIFVEENLVLNGLNAILRNFPEKEI